MADTPDIDYASFAAPLGAWLVDHLDGADDVEVGDFDRPGGGYSAETLLVPVRVTRGDTTTQERVVIRREMPKPPVYPVQAEVDHEIEIQWRVMRALARHGEAPIAPLLGFETDPAVLGAPFFAMGFVGGEVPREDPMYVTDGFYVTASPEQRAGMIAAGIDTMADIHAVDVEEAGLRWLAPAGPGEAGEAADGRRQLRIWREYAERELDGRPHDLMLAAFDRCDAEIPAGGPTVLTWGDARLGNIIWQDHRPACCTDFEAAALAAPEMDLGWWLMFEQWAHRSSGVDPLPGSLPIDAQVERYSRRTGHEVDDIRPWMLFAAARYAAIVVRVMNRWVDRGALPADQTVYLGPIAPVLEPLLEGRL
jgi:aminoglycoside phosphotransferase (APT) family kinase protein